MNASAGLRSGLAGMRWPNTATLVLIAGGLALAVPTLYDVARLTWISETGAHGPIVLLTGLWLIARSWPAAVAVAAPPPAWRAAVVFGVCATSFMLARLTQVIELEGYLMYATLVACGYALVGGQVLVKLAFPILYLSFIFPPPETLIYTLTMPMKIAISEAAVRFLQVFGLPIGGTGVTIQIGTYQLLVAAACSGLNSIVSLAALTTFYIYVRHASHLKHAVVLALFVVPVAVAANFVRVLILILLTYYAGESVAQGFAHDLAGLVMFVIALSLIFAIDSILLRLRPGSAGPDPGQPMPATAVPS